MNTLISEMTPHGPELVDIFDKLANNRILFLFDEITDQVAVEMCATLFLLDNGDKKITIFLNSEGGDIRNIMMIYDVLQMIKSPIEIIATGTVSNEAVLILASGTPTMRFATENTLIIPSQIVQDKYQYSDLTDANSLLDRMTIDNKAFMAALAKKTGKKLGDISKDFERRKFLDPKQAQKYGIIDSVVGS